MSHEGFLQTLVTGTETHYYIYPSKQKMFIL